MELFVPGKRVALMATAERLERAGLAPAAGTAPPSLISFPVVPSKTARWESVADAGPTTLPAPVGQVEPTAQVSVAPESIVIVPPEVTWTEVETGQPPPALSPGKSKPSGGRMQKFPAKRIEESFHRAGLAELEFAFQPRVARGTADADFVGAAFSHPRLLLRAVERKRILPQ